MIPIDLADKVAIVTGASQGLGAATATALHRAGAGVVVNYFHDDAGVNRRRAEAVVAALGDRAIALDADVRDHEQVGRLFDRAAEHFTGVDIVVNNAAVLRDRTLAKMTDHEWQDVIDTNLTGVFHVCRVAGRVLRDGGRIVNMASIAAFVGFFGQSNYAAAKAGVVAMTKVLSRELAKRRINVNAVAPGVALTEMGKSIPENVRSEMLKNIPLARFAEPDDIAHAALFLCSDLASYITGQTLHVNGGWYA